MNLYGAIWENCPGAALLEGRLISKKYMVVTFSLSTKGGGSLSMLLFLASLLRARAAGERDLLTAVTGDLDFIIVTGDFDFLIVTGDLDFLIVTGDFDFLTVTGDLDFLSLGLRSAMPQQ